MAAGGQGQPPAQTQALPGQGQPTYQPTQQPTQGWGYQQQPQAANIGVQAGDAGQAGRRPTGAETSMYTDLSFNDLSAAEPAIPPSTGRSKYGTM